ncbi:zinc-binding dehydrogenase [Burkholderia sp. Ac-20353]|uniref:zinc-binding dehydrogenase n=1 Tax=Burkholderia sp. Ac-20353 TaxID=2703894 RepID=UPI00197B335B|nr:zinc-binding dehydrogenase [Burkholderia sp. Ac-20353]MBN3788347.1 zinc-binding dehydrogenase [Burkholderia sp. Ac-20353]
MKAVVRQQYGGPDQLRICEVPDPEAGSGEVLVRVRAFGLNRAEQYFRLGLWGDVAAISGIECAGEVVHDPGGALLPGQRVFALMGGLGRTRSGSYAERVAVPAANVSPIRSTLGWSELAAIPASYATAWSCLFDNLSLRRGDTLLIRGATSSLGQAAVNLARHARARTIVTVRDAGRASVARENGADQVIVDGGETATACARIAPGGFDAVLDLVGTRTMLESLRLVRRGGRVCVAGFLGGHESIEHFDPLAHLPSGRHLSFFGSAFVYGTPEYPLTDIPFQQIVELVEAGTLRAKPARVFAFDEIQAAHRLLDEGAAGGKIVVELGARQRA